ncbi:MAG: DUF2312 domain-containing protein [Gemmatimonadetes bacterium]|nr:DUF2312 domain-containing protein [Gemmatimonadota bacterium]
MTGKGHNGPPRGIDVTAAQVASLVERIERLNADKAAINEDIAEVYKEARGEGYDVPTLKRVIQRRAKSEADLHEADELLRVYEDAILRAGLAHAHEAP